MKISVIMPCFLGEYEGCASNREQKLIRAIHSFNTQTHEDRELVIVSDGCEDTIRVANQFNIDKNISKMAESDSSVGQANGIIDSIKDALSNLKFL
jgi:glycosyltransferase involved in cell wall biosynthesis